MWHVATALDSIILDVLVFGQKELTLVQRGFLKRKGENGNEKSEVLSW